MATDSPALRRTKLKVLLLGDANVGKTCVLNQFVDREYAMQYRPTVGQEFRSRQVDIDGLFVTLDLWDTAGQERYRSLTTTFYRGASICVLIYDITAEPSFQNIEFWFTSFKQICCPIPPGFPFLLIGNKMDDAANRQVSYERGLAVALENDFLFFEVSAKLCQNIVEAFEAAVSRALRGSQPQTVKPMDFVNDRTDDALAKDTFCRC
jgi:Ras-related protein Rab-7A